MMSFLHGEQYPACLVSPDQSAQQLAQLKVDMHKAFTYSEGKAGLVYPTTFLFSLVSVYPNTFLFSLTSVYPNTFLILFSLTSVYPIVPNTFLFADVGLSQHFLFLTDVGLSQRFLILRCQFIPHLILTDVGLSQHFLILRHRFIPTLSYSHWCWFIPTLSFWLTLVYPYTFFSDTHWLDVPRVVAHLMPSCLRRGTEIPGGAWQREPYPMLHCHHKNDSCIKMGSGVSCCNVLQSDTTKDMKTKD